MRRCDVLVIGGGVVGQATAFWLLRKAPGLEVVVLERDPTYREASSGLRSRPRAECRRLTM